ncbi:unnamed protein product [Allacma fusca]|uniref:Uncharacterized protein n=1 Tax=Allacma fusca TaxID=39272 RepID=A0A8J2P8U4_9HEXA|nr:unnamed protein product [Allacma fusca]
MDSLVKVLIASVIAVQLVATVEGGFDLKLRTFPDGFLLEEFYRVTYKEVAIAGVVTSIFLGLVLLWAIFNSFYRVKSLINPEESKSLPRRLGKNRMDSRTEELILSSLHNKYARLGSPDIWQKNQH